MSRLVPRGDAFDVLLERLVALQGRDVIVRITTPTSPLEGMEALAGFAGRLSGACEDADRSDVLFIPIGAGGVSIHADRLGYVGATDAGGVAYVQDGLVVRVDPTDALAPAGEEQAT